MMLPFKKKKQAETTNGITDIGDVPITNASLPPDGEAMPPGMKPFDISTMNRSERRRIGKKHHFKIEGTNKPLRKVFSTEE